MAEKQVSLNSIPSNTFLVPENEHLANKLLDWQFPVRSVDSPTVPETGLLGLVPRPQAKECEQSDAFEQGEAGFKF